MVRQCLEVKCPLGFGGELESSAAGSALMVRDEDSLDVSFLHAREVADYLGYFGGCAVYVSWPEDSMK